MRKTKDQDIIIASDLKKLPKYCTYDGNVQLKRSGIKLSYTPEHIQELARCATDIVYFAENYVTIVDPDRGKVLIELRDYQKRLLEHYYNNRFSVILASRQIGKSTITAVFILHYILFNKDKKAAIIANKASIAKEIFNKVRVAYERLPYWLQIGVVEWAKTSCQLENGSHAFSVATTADGIRGITANLILLDEFAFIRRNIAEEFISGVYPTISASKESRIIMVSTPNGLNHFYEFYNKAEKKVNDFKHFRVDWWQVPGRDENWKKETIRNLGNVRFNQEYANFFLGSSYTLVPVKYLEGLMSSDNFELELNDHFKVYTQPIKNHIYVLGVDTSKGTGRDYAVVQVIDITNWPFKQVAVYRNNEILTYDYANEIMKIAKKYNNGYIMCENNDIGEAITNRLWFEFEYENLVNYGGKNEVGIRATGTTKPKGLYYMRDLIQNRQLELVDSTTIYELGKFIEIREGKYAAEEGENDDTIMALCWACFITFTNYLDHDIIEKSITDKKDDDEVDETTAPVDPVIVDGSQHETEENWLL